MLKYLAAVLDIPRCNVYRTEKPQINAENKAVTIGTYEDPTAALAICLASLNNSASLHAMSHILGITPKMMSDISYNVVSYIAESFSHLLNTDNCTYNNSYLQLLVDKSSRPMHGMKQFTTHMIDGTYTRITKPIRRINSRFDIVWDLERQCETVRLQFVSDCLGMFTDVSSAACGTNTDRSLFTSSGVAKRLSKLKYKDTNFYVVGDSAYVSGTLPENEETKFFDCDDENGWNIYGAPLKNGSPKSQNKISMLKSFIERAFEFRNDLFEPMGKEDTQRRSLTRLSKENMAISVLTNLHQILYKSTWSQLISDVLPVDFYLLMWGALSDKKPLPVDL